MSSESQFSDSSIEEYDGEEICRYEDAFPKLKALDPIRKLFLSDKTPLPRLKSNLVTRTFNIPAELRSSTKDSVLNSGKKPEIVFSKTTPKEIRLGNEEKKIVDKKLIKLCQGLCGNIDFSESLDGSLLVTLTCQESKFQEIKAKIKKNQEVHFTKKIQIPADYYGSIKGAKGVNVRTIEEETGTTIKFPPISTNSDIVEISGPRNEVDIAIERLMARVNQLYMNSYKRLDIPCKYHRLVLAFSTNPSLANFLENNQGSCLVRIPPYSAMKDEILITGERDLLDQAEEMIKTTYDFISRNATEMQVTIDKEKRQFLLKNKSEFINRILQEDAVSILISVEKKDQVILIGKGSRFSAVITKMLKHVNSFSFAKINAPSWLQKYVIGREGIRAATAIRRFPTLNLVFKRDANLIEIEGLNAEVNEVAEEFRSLVDSYARAMSQEIIETIEPDLMKTLKSKESRLYREVKRACGPSVTISLDPVELGLVNSILLEGLKEKVTVAGQRIRQLLSEQMNSKSSDFIIDADLVSRVIGNQQRFLRDTRLTHPDVKVKFIEAQINSSADCRLNLSGNRESVDQLLAQLRKRTKDVQLANYTEKISILTSLFVGKKSVSPQISVGSLRTRYDVIIDSNPDKTSGLTTLTITGRQMNVQECIGEIQSLNANQENLTEVSVDVEPSLMSYIIGQGGQRINAIRDMSGGNVTFKFPSPNSKRSTVRIMGPKEQVGLAQKYLLETTNEANQVVGSTRIIRLNVFSVIWFYQQLSQRTLSEQFSVTIELPKYQAICKQACQQTEREQEKTNQKKNKTMKADRMLEIKLHGQPEDLDKANVYIEQLVTSQQLEDFTIQIPGKIVALFRYFQRNDQTIDRYLRDLPEKPKCLNVTNALGGVKEICLLDSNFPRDTIHLLVSSPTADNKLLASDLVQDIFGYLADYNESETLINHWHMRHLNRFYKKHLTYLEYIYNIRIRITPSNVKRNVDEMTTGHTTSPNMSNGNRQLGQKNPQKQPEQQQYHVHVTAHCLYLKKMIEKLSLWKPVIEQMDLNTDEMDRMRRLTKGRLIGLERDLNVFIDFDEVTSVVRIIGNETDVIKALSEMRQTLLKQSKTNPNEASPDQSELTKVKKSKREEQTTESVILPASIKRLFLGYQNRNLISLRINHSVRVTKLPTDLELVTDDDLTLVIEGTSRNLVAFKTSTEGIINSLMELTSHEISIPQRFHSRLIGRGGRIVDLQNEHQVFIEFPVNLSKRGDVEKACRPESYWDMVRVFGHLDSIRIASEYLLNEMEKFVNQEKLRLITKQEQEKSSMQTRRVKQTTPKTPSSNESSGLGSSLATNTEEKGAISKKMMMTKTKKSLSIIGGPWKEEAGDSERPSKNSWSAILKDN